jgi:hypothetical protein
MFADNKAESTNDGHREEHRDVAIPGIPEICFGTRCLKTVRAEPVEA